MYNNLQPTDAVILSERTTSSVSSNVVFVGGAFTIQFPDGQFAEASTANTQSVSAYVTNANPFNGTPPVGGHTGGYGENPGFETAWTFAGTLNSSTGVGGGAIFNYTNPVRYVYIKSPEAGTVKGGPTAGLRAFTNAGDVANLGASLTGYVYNGSNL